MSETKKITERLDCAGPSCEGLCKDWCCGEDVYTQYIEWLEGSLEFPARANMSHTIERIEAENERLSTALASVSDTVLVERKRAEAWKAASVLLESMPMAPPSISGFDTQWERHARCWVIINERLRAARKLDQEGGEQ